MNWTQLRCLRESRKRPLLLFARMTFVERKSFSSPSAAAGATCRSLAAAWLLVALGTGCNLSEVAADTTANVLSDAAPAARAHFDYETAGLSAASGLVQLEGLH